MHLKPNQNHPNEAQDSDLRDPAQPWLDLGRWLAGETVADKSACSDHFRRRIPSFAGLVERHFRDLVAYVAQGNPLELRQAMHRRFIHALHLAFGSENLADLAACQPAHLFQLIEHLRADFDLLPEQSESPTFPSHRRSEPVARMWAGARGGL